MSTLKLFSLEGKQLKLTTAAEIAPHIEALKADNDSFERIDLNGNTLGIEACQALAEVIKNRKNLKEADFKDVFTGRLREEIPDALTALCNAFLTCPNLNTINLSDNAFGLATEKPLIDFLALHGPLQHLILANNGLGPFCGANVAKSLVKLAEVKAASSGEFPPLETVICGRNRLENGSMDDWAEVYRVHNKVRTVKMVQNGIRPEGIATLISKGLSNCADLETMDLQDNTFTLSGSTALGKAIVGWTKLLELGVGDSLLGARGGVLLAEALAKGNNKGLKILRLQYNELDIASVKALKTALDSLPVLEQLELNGNKFSEDDPVVDDIKAIFEDRGVGELDELDDMEEDSDDEDEEDEDSDKEAEDEQEKRREDVVKRTAEAEDDVVALEKDKEVDDLADAFAKKATV